MATMHVMVGLPCSGKTTKAKMLEKDYNALLLTPDYWYIKLFGNRIIEETHNLNHGIIEKIMLEVAERALILGIDVILDFGFWAREERIYLKKKSKEIGVNFKLHYLEISNDELFTRLEKRNRELPERAFMIPRHKMEEYIKMFQPPLQDEF